MGGEENGILIEMVRKIDIGRDPKKFWKEDGKKEERPGGGT